MLDICKTCRKLEKLMQLPKIAPAKTYRIKKSMNPITPKDHERIVRLIIYGDNSETIQTKTKNKYSIMQIAGIRANVTMGRN